ncbi:MAG: lysozyme [Phenylobacterium sp.]|nr:lysozyme [Phenylobacterium sp.]
MTDTLPVSAEKPARFVPSPELIADLKVAEGLRLKAYRDTVDIWTVGYGHAHVLPGTVWTQAQADAELLEDIAQAAAQCDAHLPWWRSLCPVRQDALVELMFNLGWGDGKRGLSTFTNSLAKLRAGNFVGASAGLLLSKWSDQVGARAERIAAQIRTGVRR